MLPLRLCVRIESTVKPARLKRKSNCRSTPGLINQLPPVHHPQSRTRPFRGPSRTCSLTKSPSAVGESESAAEIGDLAAILFNRGESAANMSATEMRRRQAERRPVKCSVARLYLRRGVGQWDVAPEDAVEHLLGERQSLVVACCGYRFATVLPEILLVVLDPSAHGVRRSVACTQVALVLLDSWCPLLAPAGLDAPLGEVLPNRPTTRPGPCAGRFRG